jgi:peptide deformylase
MHEMCMVGRGDYSTAYAIAHSQINDEDPLRFFVTVKGEIYINPVIVSNHHELNQVQEGCMSYPEEPMKTVVRFKKITAKYRTVAHKVNSQTGEEVAEPYLTKEIVSDFDGMMSHILQHECQHLNGWDIYSDGSSALKAIGEPIIQKPLTESNSNA